MAEEKANLFGDDINATPLDKLVQPPMRMTGEISSRKNEPPVEPLAYNPNIPDDPPPPTMQQQQPQQQQQLRQRRPPKRSEAPHRPPPPSAAYEYPAITPTANYYPAPVQPPPQQQQQHQLPEPPKKSKWIATIERHGRAATVAFLVFALLWYAMPHLLKIGMLRNAFGTGLSMPGTIGVSIGMAVIFAMLDNYVLAI